MILATLTIPIINLPTCYAKTMLLDMAVDHDVLVNVVATQGGAKDWACYIGFPRSLDDIRPEKRDAGMEYYVREVSSTEGVASNGDKVSKAVAEELFPSFSNLRYRE